jgi:ABC-2 type transport system permease protein
VSVPVPDSWAMQNPVIYSLLWAAAIVAIFAPLSARQYRLSTSK